MGHGDKEMVLEYFEEKKFEVFKSPIRKGSQSIILKYCPLCGKESDNTHERFCIDLSTSMWVSNCCGEHGNLFKLKRLLGDLDSTRASGGYGDASRFDKYLAASAKNQAAQSVEIKAPDGLTQGLVDRMHKALLADKLAMEILQAQADKIEGGRGFTLQTIKDMKFGLAKRMTWKCPHCGTYTSVRAVNPKQPKKCGQGCEDTKDKQYCRQPLPVAKPDMTNKLLAVPIFLDGKPVNVKFRTITGRKGFDRIAGAETTIFNIDNVKGKYKELHICEAELDAASLHQYGLEAVVSLVGGVGSGPAIIEQYREHFVDFDAVYLWLDDDAKPDLKKRVDAAALEISQKLGQYRCFRVTHPNGFKDANECLANGTTKDEIFDAVKNATAYSKQLVKHISEFKNLLNTTFSPQQLMGVSTGITELDAFMGGMHGSDLTIVTGGTGSGKSTLMTRIAYNVTRLDRGVLVAAFELGNERTFRKLLAMSGWNDPMVMTDDERLNAFNDLCQYQLYLLDHWGKMPFSELEDYIEYGVRRWGIWLVILDHFHFFLERAQDERRQIEETLDRILALCKRLNIHIMMVVHPGKMRRDRYGKEIPPDLNDLKGASALEQGCAQALRVWVPRDVERVEWPVDVAKITVLKSRDDSGCEGTAVFRYRQESHTYDPWTDQDTAELAKLRSDTKLIAHPDNKKKKTSLKGDSEAMEVYEKIQGENWETTIGDDDE